MEEKKEHIRELELKEQNEVKKESKVEINEQINKQIGEMVKTRLEGFTTRIWGVLKEILG